MLNENLTFDSKMSSNSTEPRQTPKVAVDVVKLMFFLIIMLTTLIGNSLVCMAVVNFRNLRTHTNLVLVSLAATDLSMVFVMALNAATAVTTEWPFGEKWCDIIASAGLTIAFISILHLCFLSVDRFMAIHSPFQYPFLVTRRRVSVILPLLWIFPIVALHLPIADITFRGQVYGCSKTDYTPTHSQMFYTFILVAVFVAVPFIIMLITHAYVFTIAFRHARRLGIMERSVRTRTEDNQLDSHSSSGKSISKSISKSLEFTRLRREIKSAKTFALIVGAFLLCYLPFFTAATYRKYSGSDAISHNAMLIMTWVAFSNSFCNPLLYGVRYKPFRKAFKRLCCSCCTAKGILGLSTQGESFTMTQAKSLGVGSILRFRPAEKENRTRSEDWRGKSEIQRSGTESTDQQVRDTDSVPRVELETREIGVESKHDNPTVQLSCKAEENQKDINTTEVLPWRSDVEDNMEIEELVLTDDQQLTSEVVDLAPKANEHCCFCESENDVQSDKCPSLSTIQNGEQKGIHDTEIFTSIHRVHTVDTDTDKQSQSSTNYI